MALGRAVEEESDGADMGRDVILGLGIPLDTCKCGIWVDTCSSKGGKHERIGIHAQLGSGGYI